MPPIILVVAGLGLALSAGPALAIFGSLLLSEMMINIGLSLVLGGVSKLFHKNPGQSSLSHELASRTVTTRQPVSPWKVAYGSNRMGGIITFLHTTGANNEFLQLVITLTGHEVSAIPAMYFDGVQVPLDGSGNATGNFAGFVHAEFNLGTKDQAAFPGLVTAAPTYWTSAYRQRGRAGVYVQLKWDQNKFPNGVPNITFDVSGRKVYDPRSGTIAYSTNAALCIADYLNNASFGLVAQTKAALAAGMLTASGLGGFTAANCVDGDITTAGWNTDTAIPNANLQVDLGASITAEFRRCRVYAAANLYAGIYDIQYSDNGTIWTAAATGFQPNVIGWNEVELAPNGAHRYWRLNLTNTPGATGTLNELEFYTSDVDSTQLIAAANTCDEAVTLAAGGSESRFTISGSFGTDEKPADVIGRMNSAMAGSVVYIAGKWGVYPGIWRAPTVSLTDADFRGPFTVQTRMAHRDLYNGVKGTFISPTNKWQISDYPPFQSAAYLQEDNNEPLWLDVELPFTISGATAQRLSKIALRRARRQIAVQGQFKLTAYQVQPLDVVQLSHPRFGWTNKTFEVAACSLVYAPDNKGSGSAPAVGVDLTLRETDSTVYDWTTADEVQLNAPPTTVLPQNAVVQAPTSLSVTSSEIIRAADSSAVSGILVTWTSPADQFVLAGGHIIVQYKKTADSLWITAGKLDGSATKQLITGVQDGISYDARIWAENASGVKSAIVSGSVTPGASATPFSAGKNMLANPGFESNLVGTPANSTLTALNTPMTDGWYLGQNDNGVFWFALDNSSNGHGGANSLWISLGDGKTIPNGASYAGVIFSQAKIPVAIGDIVRVSGWIQKGGYPAPPAGVTFGVVVGLAIYNNAGTYLGTIGNTVSPQTGFIQSAQTIPATLGGGIPSYGRFAIDLNVANSSGSSFSSGTGNLYGFTRFDDVKCVIQNTAFDVTPINTSGAPTVTTTALTQSGTSTTINVASKTIQFGDGPITYNAGSVNPGAYGTYFVFADDPTYSGGAVTYQASTLESDVYASNGRIYFGVITTTSGGGATGGTGGGSGGGRLRLT